MYNQVEVLIVAADRSKTIVFFFFYLSSCVRSDVDKNSC